MITTASGRLENIGISENSKSVKLKKLNSSHNIVGEMQDSIGESSKLQNDIDVCACMYVCVCVCVCVCV